MQVNRPPAAGTEGTLDKKHGDLKKATQQFEGYFLHELLKEMRKTVPEDKLLGDDGHGQEIFRDMMDQTLSETLSQRGDFGLARMMYDQLAPTLGGDGTQPKAQAGGTP
jgi:flagellar protein FlgJ